jgi:hypothetical protein
MAQLQSTNIYGTLNVKAMTTSLTQYDGAMVVSGGMGVVENLNIGGNIKSLGSINGLTISTVSNKSLDLSNASLTVGTSSGTGKITITSNNSTDKSLTLNRSFTLSGDADRTITINNANKTISGAGTTLTFGGNFTTVGSSNITITSTASTTITLPTSGTLATLENTETLTNKALTSPIIHDIKASSSSVNADAWSEITTGNITIGSSLTTGKIQLGKIGSLSEVNGDLSVHGSLIVNGTTTTVNSSEISVDDKNIELGAVSPINNLSGTITASGTTCSITMASTNGLISGMPVSKVSGTGAFGTNAYILTVNSSTQITVKSDTNNTSGSIVFNASGVSDLTADGGGITLKGSTNKTILWNISSNNWSSSENWNLSSGKVFKIDDIMVLSSTSLGDYIVNSSLTKLGNVKTLTVVPNSVITTQDRIIISPNAVGEHSRSITITTPIIALTSDLTFTLPNIGTNADFLLTAGSQYISGEKTFENSKLKIKGSGTGSIIISNQNTTNEDYTLNLPVANDILIGRNTNDTLTNKILTSPIIHDIKASSTSTNVDAWSEITTGNITIGSNLTTGKIQLGKTSSSTEVNGDLEVKGFLTESSDRRLKTDIVSIKNPVEKVMKLNGCLFKKVNSNKISMGLIAQEVKEVIPEVVNENSDGYLGIQYSNIVALLIESIKEQQMQILNLEEKLESKKSRNKILKLFKFKK